MIVLSLSLFLSFFFFNDTATTEIYTLSLHDALPILKFPDACVAAGFVNEMLVSGGIARTLGEVQLTPETSPSVLRSEEHTSELQSRGHLVCRLLLEKKKKKREDIYNNKQ